MSLRLDHTGSSTHPDPSALLSPGRRAGLWLSACLALAILAWSAYHAPPVTHSVLWTLAGVWLLTLLWGASVLGAGLRLLTWLRFPSVTLRERAVVGFSLGVLSFSLGVFVVGLGHGLGRLFFVLLPLLHLALGARELRTLARCGWRVRRWRVRHGVRRSSWPAWLALAVGLGCLAALYLACLVPANITYDARWYHLPLAEHYRASGAIVRFGEGWFFGAYPQLASYLYTWAQFCPGQELTRLWLCAHLEFLFLGATLAGIAALTRRLLRPGLRVVSWPVYFAFPAVFLYRPALGADTVAASWVVPLYLACARAWPALGVASLRVTALLGAGLLLTKYSAVSALALPLLALVSRAVYLTWRPGAAGLTRWQPLGRLALAALLGLVATSPHWLKNWVWYGSPLYPLLRGVFTPRPWTPTAEHMQHHFWQTRELWRPPPGWSGYVSTFEVLFTFSFEPHEFGEYRIHGPQFGSLFSLSLLLLPWLPGVRRLWLVHLAVLLGVALWFRIHHQDRYLMVLLPLMVASTVAIFARVAAEGRFPAALVALLLLGQTVWGLRIYAYRAPLSALVALLTEGDPERQRASFRENLSPWSDLARSLPARAVVLVHDNHTKLGLGRRSVSDAIGWQGGLDYLQLGSPARIARALRQLGVTHVVTLHQKSLAYDSLGADAAFFWFLARATSDHRTVGSLDVSELSPRDAPDLVPQVALLDCSPHEGLYPLDALALPGLSTAPPPTLAPTRPAPPARSARATWASFLAPASVVLLEPRCHEASSVLPGDEFVRAASRDSMQIWTRR